MSQTPPSNPLTAKIADPASVDAAILNRISVRAFRPDPVPRAMLEEIISISKRAPSGTNTQPWHVYVLTGAVRDEICDKVCRVFDDIYEHPELAAQYKPHFKYYPDNWVEPYIGRRREVGWTLYGLLGIEKGDKEKMHAQHRRNFRFFDAPVGMVFTMSRMMGQGSLLDCGTFMQNVMLAARARGLHTCAQAAWNDFGSIVLPAIGAAEDEVMVCAMALGWANEDERVNTFTTRREPLENFTQWLGWEDR